MLLKEYSAEQIKSLVEIIKDCARENRFVISLEECKIENTQFIEEYNINANKRINILSDLDYKDFCYGLQNMKDGVEQNNLYVFCTQKQLYNIDNKSELVDIYLKFNIIYNNNKNYYVLVSLHKRNKPITYLFK